MEHQFETPVLTEMMTQINSFQKENMNQVMDTMNRSLREKIPMKIFCVEKLADTPMTGYFSDVFNMTEKVSKEMIENSMDIMPALFKNDKDSFILLKKKMTEAPAEFMAKMKGILPDEIAEPQKEKINNILEKLVVCNTATIEFLYSIFIPMWDETQAHLGKDIAGTPKKKKTA